MFFKEKMPLNEFINSLVAGSLQGEFDVSPVDSEGSLSVDEKCLLTNNLHGFLLVVLHSLFLDKLMRGKLKASAEGVGHQFGKAVVFAYHKTGLSPDEAGTKGEEYLKAFDEYITVLEGQTESDIKKQGMFIFFCRHYASKFLPNFDPKDPVQMDKHFIAFDIARQVYRNTEEAFNTAYNSVRVIP